jgi:hypothetical protein
MDYQGKPDTSIDDNDNNDDRRETKSLLQEAIECLAESNLIYLLADLFSKGEMVHYSVENDKTDSEVSLKIKKKKSTDIVKERQVQNNSKGGG